MRRKATPALDRVREEQSAVSAQFLIGPRADIVIPGPANANPPINGSPNDDNIFGTEDDDIINGLGGNDRIRALGGNDTLDGGIGADELVGGAGNDLYIVEGGDTVVELASEGTDTIQTAASVYQLVEANVENLTYTGGGSFSGVGNALNNRITGGPGNDELAGGNGDDTYVVTVGDTIVEALTGGSDLVLTNAPVYVMRAPNIEYLSYTGGGNFVGVGNSQANIITGGPGNDELAGGNGNDIYNLTTAGDTIFETASGGLDRLLTALPYYHLTAPNVEILGYEGTGDFFGVGSDQGDIIFGGAGNDILNGGLGSDTLVGEGGASDRFLFDSALGPTNIDTIADFLSGSDYFLLENSIFTALGTGVLPPGAFVNGTVAGDADDRILYDQATGKVFYDADGNGAGAAVQFAAIMGNPAIAASDFVVI